MSEDLGVSDVHVGETKLVAVQLETCHANTDGSAWYGYFTGTLDHFVRDCGLSEVCVEIEDAAEKEKAPLGIEVVISDWEEVPNALSRYTNLKRFYVGAAV